MFRCYDFEVVGNSQLEIAVKRKAGFASVEFQLNRLLVELFMWNFSKQEL
jgi:hypothetical protein